MATGKVDSLNGNEQSLKQIFNKIKGYHKLSVQSAARDRRFKRN